MFRNITVDKGFDFHLQTTFIERCSKDESSDLICWLVDGLGVASRGKEVIIDAAVCILKLQVGIRNAGLKYVHVFLQLTVLAASF